MRANRYVSYLAAEIEPKALATLNAFERDAVKAMDAIVRANTRGAAALGQAALGTTSTRNIRELGNAATDASRKVDQITRSSERAAVVQSRLAGTFARTADSLQIVQGPLGPLAGRLSALGNVLRNLTGFTLGGVLAGGGAFALGSIATQYQKVEDRLRPFFKGQQDLNRALNDVIGIAGRSRQALQPVADLYAQISRVAQDAGISQQRASRVTEIVGKATRIGGGSPEAVQGAIVQFTQALTANFHGSGQELQSILEQTPVLARAIAQGLGTTSSKLKQLAKDGQLTTEAVIKALERSGVEIDEQFARMPKRIGSSLTALSNALAVYVGRIDESAGGTALLANSVGFLADHLGATVTVIETLGVALLASKFASAVEGISTYIGSVAAANGASRALTTAVAEGNAVMLGTREAAAARATYLSEAAVAERAAATAAIETGVVYKAQAEQQILLLNRQVAAQTRAAEQARLLDAASRGRGAGGRSDLVKSTTLDLAATNRALAATEAELAAITAELAAADVRLATAGGAVTAALAEETIAMNIAAAGATRLGATKLALQAAMGRVTSAAGGLVNFLGGPWGAAFAAAGTIALLLANRTDAAKDAAERFAGGQDEFRRQLGLTTSELYKQSDAARALALSLAQANVIKAKSVVRDANTSLAGSLEDSRLQINSSLFGNTQGDKDRATLARFVAAAKAGRRPNEIGQREILDIYSRNPQLAQGNPISRLLGSDPADTVTKLIGVTQTVKELTQAERDLHDVQTNLAKPRENLLGGGKGTKPETAAQRRARLNRSAAVDGAANEIARARAELAQAKASGPISGETDDAYTARIAQMTEKVNGLVAAHAAAVKGAAAHNKALREAAAAAKHAAVEFESASDKRDKLLNIVDTYTDDSPIKRLDKIYDSAAKAKRQVADLVEDLVKMGKLTPGQGQATVSRIDNIITAGAERDARRPVKDAADANQKNLRILDLQARGEGTLAEFTKRRIELEEKVGPLKDAELTKIAKQVIAENDVNDVLDKRNAIIENNAQFIGQVRDAGRDAIRSFLGGDLKGGIKNFATKIKNAFLDAKANEIAIKLFGDPEKKYRDEMTRGLNNSADKLVGSATSLEQAGGKLDRAADALSGAAAGGGPGTLPGTGVTADTAATDALYSNITNALNGVQDAVSAKTPTTTEIGPDGVPIITVTGSKKPLPIELPKGVDSVLGNLLGKVGGVGGAVSIASSASSVFKSLFGKNQGTTGDRVSNALGSIAQTVGQFVPQFGAALAATSAISSALGLKNFAGGTFGVLGNLAAKLFGYGKAPTGSTTITSVTGANAYSGSGTLKDQLSPAGLGVQAGIKQIQDALGGKLGQFAVSIGYNAKTKQYVVDDAGRGRLTSGDSHTPEFKTEEEAVRYAIMNAIQDGAIAGIRASTQRLLRSGSDLGAALEKALKFEGVFKELKAIKDPVGAAIDDLNTKFQSLIGIFTEAGASAEEWAQLRELYDLQRTDAIKQATVDSVKALNDFIQSLTSGPDSPLSRQTVYANAADKVGTFRADIAAGKAVDQDALIKALQDFQAASSTLNGSREQFFSDFNDILGLANQAKSNVPAPSSAALPASPFDTLTPIAQQQLAEAQKTNDILAMIAAGMAGPSSTIAMLPGSTGGSIGGGGYVPGRTPTSGGYASALN